MNSKARKKSPKKNLKLRKKPLADLPPAKNKAADIRGGSFAPPYVPSVRL